MKTNLQKMRKAAGFKSADAFADSIDMSRSTYKNYEQGARMMTLEVAWELADHLGCTLDELAGRVPPGVDREATEVAKQFSKLTSTGRIAVIEMIDLQLSKSGVSMSNNPVSGVA